MRIAILSCFYPFRGGISQFNASLLGELGKTHTVRAFNFTRQYPQFLFPGKFPGQGRTQFFPAGTEIDSAGVRIPGGSFPHGGDNRLGHHDHAGAAAERVVVRIMMLAVGIGADISQPDFQQALFLRPAEDTRREHAGKHFREDRQDVDPQGRLTGFAHERTATSSSFSRAT